MRLRVLLVALIAALLLGWGHPMLAQLLSPGKLAAPHAKLEGDDQCGKCHASGKRVSDPLCTACHGDIGAAIASGRGMHGTVWKGQGCPTCHSEHRGTGFALVRFDKKAFPHAKTGFPLEGAHATADCARCHQKGWMGVTRACAGCHQDAHAGRFGNNCAGCHEETKWTGVKMNAFDHSLARFPLKGAHATAPCEGCHGTPAKYRGLEFDACSSCHQDPHKGRFAAACSSCHTEKSWHSLVMQPGAHPRLSLANGHARVPCRKCHDRGALVSPTLGAACSGCHGVVHEAPFGSRCESCHSSIKWLGLPKKVGLQAHSKTPFPLHGSHAGVACDACHSPKRPAAERFRKLEFTRCKDCHSDPHSGQFARLSEGECGTCHTDDGFSPSSFGPSEHAATAFPLVGHHLAVPCGECHHFDASAKQRLDWHQTQAACATCHQNPHGTEFADVISKKGCGGCHSATGWDTPNIDHRSWPLTGAHAAARCDRCHSATAEDRKQGRGPSYENAPTTCEGCHTDVHAGQFRLTAPERGCATCHDTTTFAIGRFDHAGKTGFTLTGKHGTLACASCHAKEKLETGATATRYRLGYRTCQSCHADPHSGGER